MIFKASNQSIINYLVSKGYSGTADNMMVRYLESRLGNTSGTLNDLLLLQLQRLGYSSYGCLNDMLNRFFADNDCINQEDFFKNIFTDIGYAPYYGPVATRCRLNNSYSTSTSVQYIQSRTVHTATDNINSLIIIFSDIYPAGTSENAIALGGTITASVEYPADTFTQVTWSSSSSGTLNNTNLISDEITLSTPIPMGATFWIRNYRVGSGTNFPYSVDGLNWLFSSTGERCDVGSTARTDKTMGGTITNNAFNNQIYRPTAIIGKTSKPTIFIMGDSRSRISDGGGSRDVNFDTRGLVGELERAVYRKNYGFINCSVSGDSYFNITTANAYTKRAALAQYCTHVLDNYGINDLGTSASISTSTLNSYIGTMRTVIGNTKKYYKCTLTPRSTSTDTWVTVGNQTAVTSTTSRLQWNNALRNGTLSNVDGFVEIADLTESSRDSGFFASYARTLTNDISSTISSTTITSAGGNFVSSDVGKSIIGIGGGEIRSVTNATTAVLQDVASASNTNVTASIGTPTRDGLHNTEYTDTIIEAGNPMRKIC